METGACSMETGVARNSLHMDMRSMEVIQVKDARSGYWIRGRVTLDQIIKEGKMCIELKSGQCRWLIWYAFMQYLSRCFSCAITCTELDTPRSSRKSNTADCTK